MATRKSARSISRRASLATMAGASLGLTVASQGTAVSMQTGTIDYSAHPMCGCWLAMANPLLPEDPQLPVPSFFFPNGFAIFSFPVAQRGPNGVEFGSDYAGTWEPYDDRTAHFTIVQTSADADGRFLSSVTVDGHPMASEAGLTFSDDGALNTVTIRDATGAIVMIVPPGTPGTPVTGVRMSPGVSGFPDDTPAATPAT